MFDQTIKQLEREVRDLRTAHTRGLGMMNFSTASATASSTSPNYYIYDIVVTFSDGETFPPICQLGANQTKGGFFGATWDSGNLTFSTQYQNSDYTDPAPTITAVASAPISSITVTAVV